MALFGEIIEPSSRAFCDFEELDATPIELTWEGQSEVPAKISTLVYVDGNRSGIELFKKSLLPHSKYICRCPIAGVTIHQINNTDQYICLFEKSQLIDTEVVEAVAAWTKTAEDVVIIQTCGMIKYQTRVVQEKPPYIIRALYYLADKKLGIKSLEQPNIVDEKAAGVLSFRIGLKKPASLFVCYLDSQTLDSLTAKPILEILTAFKVPNSPYLSGVAPLDSQLYM